MPLVVLISLKYLVTFRRDTEGSTNPWLPEVTVRLPDLCLNWWLWAH